MKELTTLRNGSLIKSHQKDSVWSTGNERKMDIVPPLFQHLLPNQPDRYESRQISFKNFKNFLSFIQKNVVDNPKGQTEKTNPRIRISLRPNKLLKKQDVEERE